MTSTEDTHTRLSLCMIAKNEEAVIARCLQSVTGLVDDVILVDTGSSDRTRSIGRQFGATVFSIPWENDFSKARNVSLQRAATEWILVLDADEVVSPADHDSIRRILKEERYFGYTLEQRTYGNDPNFINWRSSPGRYAEENGYGGYVPSVLVRLFRNDARIRFEGPVHELVEHAFSRHHLPRADSCIPIHHYGKVREPARIQQKAMQYLAIGKAKAEANPHNAAALSELGAQYLELGDFNNAATAFQKAIQCSPENAKAHVDLGVTYLRQEKLDSAQAALCNAIRLAPGQADALFNLGVVFLHQSRYEKAEEMFMRATDIRPGFGSGYASLGSVMLCGKRFEEAVPYLLKAEQLIGNDADVYCNLAWVHDRLGYPHQASRYRQRALNLRPGRPKAAAAAEQSTTRERLKPDRPAAERHLQQGEALFTRGLLEAASAAFKTACGSDPYFGEAWNNLGVTRWRRRKIEDSLPCFLRAFFLRPDDPDATENLSACCTELAKHRLWELILELRDSGNPGIPIHRPDTRGPTE